MRPNSPAGMEVIKKEEKEARLLSFVEQTLASAGECDELPHTQEILILARSPASPVARAVRDAAETIRAAGLSVRCVYTNTATADEDQAHGDADLIAGCVRLTHDARLLEAHEQLVLGHADAWIGDCMRREPGKRDAFECYAPGEPELAAWARLAFEKIWRAAEPVAVARDSDAERQIPTGPIDAIALQLGLDGDGPTVSTRH